jgi:hypothetical protein
MRLLSSHRRGESRNSNTRKELDLVIHRMGVQRMESGMRAGRTLGRCWTRRRDGLEVDERP